MLGDHVGGVLDGIACLFIGSGLLHNMGGEHVTDIVWPMRQQALDHTTAGVGVEDAITLDGKFPNFVKGRLIVDGILAGRLDLLDEQGAGIFRPAKQDSAMPADISIDAEIAVLKIRQDEPESNSHWPVANQHIALGSVEVLDLIAAATEYECIGTKPAD